MSDTGLERVRRLELPAAAPLTTEGLVLLVSVEQVENNSAGAGTAKRHPGARARASDQRQTPSGQRPESSATAQFRPDPRAHPCRCERPRPL